jgi:curved DNA-binding protein CbpA
MPMDANNLQDLYRTLDLEPEATLDDLKCSYRELVKVWHPDRFAHDPALERKSQEKLKQINLAYELLEKLLAGKKVKADTSPKKTSKKDDDAQCKEIFFQGQALFFGDGVTKDSAKAVDLLRKVAEKGFPPAQYLLGHAYRSGEGVLKSVNDAAFWWTKAAEQLHAEAQYSLGCLYNQGHKDGFMAKVVKNTVGLDVGDTQIEAYKWLNLAITYGIGRKGLLAKWEDLRYLSQRKLNEAMSRAAIFYPKYPKRTSQQIFDELFDRFLEEGDSTGHAGTRKYISEMRSKVGDLTDIRTGIREKALETLQIRFLGNAQHKTGGFFKKVGCSFWNLIRSRDDWERCIALDLVEFANDFIPVSDNFLQKRENAINQIWLNLMHR